jgi:uridine kinase
LKALFSHPLFAFGLALRILLIGVMSPEPVIDWYLPFLDATTASFSLNPWGLWLAGEGSAVAFPYGYAMWLLFLPLTLIAKLLGVPLFFGYMGTLLLADIALLLVLWQLVPGRRIKLLLAAYWLSPIVIFASYGLGFNDLLPVLLLVSALYFLRALKLEIAGALVVAAISCKLSMIIALPFFAIYLVSNRAVRQLWSRFVLGLAVAGLVFGVPFLMSREAIYMLFSIAEMGKIFHLALDLGGDTQIYLVPLLYLVLLYLVLLYAVWRVRRLNFDLFQATLGMAFLAVVLTTHAEPGWFVWAIPFLVFYQSNTDRTAMLLIGAFSALYLLSAILAHPLMFSGQQLDLVDVVSPRMTSLLQTALVATGIVLVVRMWREMVSRNDFFRLSRSPFVMGVAGDSGAGKDVFSRAIEGLFGSHSVVMLAGDSYHLWDRQKPMWQVMTHLNPMANDIEGFTNDLVSLMDGKAIQSREYDHETGRMSSLAMLKSRDFIIANGLHALYLPILRDCYHLSVYLDIDEGLRRYFKIRRDVQERGHEIEAVNDAFDKREEDAQRFIRPQVKHADLVLSLQPIHPRMIADPTAEQVLRYKLTVRTSQKFNERSLVRVLVGVCGLHVDLSVNEDNTEIEFTIEGDTSAEDVSMAAGMLCPRIVEFLDTEPEWQDGVLGLMQLVTLSHINQALTKRII